MAQSIKYGIPLRINKKKWLPPDKPPDISKMTPKFIRPNQFYSIKKKKNPNIWQKDIFQVHLVITSTDATKDILNISPLKTAKEL